MCKNCGCQGCQDPDEQAILFVEQLMRDEKFLPGAVQVFNHILERLNEASQAQIEEDEAEGEDEIEQRRRG